MLTAFNKNLSNKPDRLGKLYKSNPNEEISILRKRFSQNGYLYLKGLLNKDDVISFREWVFKNLKGTGLLQENYDFKYGIASNKEYNKSNDEDSAHSGRAQNEAVNKKYLQWFGQLNMNHFVHSLS